MDGEQFRQITEILKQNQLEMMERVDKQIVITVNGKITALTAKVDDYIASDNAYKEQIAPAIQVVSNGIGFGKVVMYILAVFAAVSTIVAGVEAFLPGRKN